MVTLYFLVIKEIKTKYRHKFKKVEYFPKNSIPNKKNKGKPKNSKKIEKYNKKMIRRVKSAKKLRFLENLNETSQTQIKTDFHSVYNKRHEVRRKKEFKKYLQQQYGEDLKTDFPFQSKQNISFRPEFVDPRKFLEFLDFKNTHFWFENNFWMDIEDMIDLEILRHINFKNYRKFEKSFHSFYDKRKKRNIENLLPFKTKIQEKLFFNDD